MVKRSLPYSVFSDPIARSDNTHRHRVLAHASKPSSRPSTLLTRGLLTGTRRRPSTSELATISACNAWRSEKAGRRSKWFYSSRSHRLTDQTVLHLIASSLRSVRRGKGAAKVRFGLWPASAFRHLLNFDDTAPRSSTMRARTGCGDRVSERNDEIG
jgi:hypothetical protein